MDAMHHRRRPARRALRDHGCTAPCIAWAEALGLTDVAEVLGESLAEEKAADEKLSALAESGINDAATAGESEDEMEEDDEQARVRRKLAAVRCVGRVRRAARSSANGSKSAARQRGGRR